MNYKILFLALYVIVYIIDLLFDYLNKKSVSLPINDNVKDVYNEEDYSKWTAYKKEKLRIKLIDSFVDFVYLFAVLYFDFFAALSSLSGNTYIQIIIVFTVFLLINTVIKLPTAYISEIAIETKYGFNKSTKKTFIADQIKGFVLSDVLFIGLISLFSSLYGIFGEWIVLVFTAVAVLIVLIISFIAPLTQKIYNKFESLEEGTLRTKLTELLDKHGYKVRDIKVMDGSRRSAKANAYFSGMGKTKTIVLYDTIIELMTEDELVAIFAHELAHGKYRHIIKRMAVNLGLIFIMVSAAYGMLMLPICEDFGFSGIDPSLIAVLLFSVVSPFITLVYGILSSYVSRTHEYQSDAFAAKEGHGKALISGLKKLARNNFACLNPHPVIVALSYSHPPLSERISAVEKIIAGENK